MKQRIRMAFEPEARMIPVDCLLPLRTIAQSMRKSPKYQRIASSLAQVGLIEPLVVFPQGASSDARRQYLILDGHLRYEILKGRGEKEVLCLISIDDDSFTHNHKVNQISPIQEHFMILRALESGVSEERIAETLNVDVAAIRKKRDLLDGICPEAVELLKERRCAPKALREIRRVTPMRQIEMAELMIAASNYSAPYAKCLVAATPQEQLAEPERAKEVEGLRPEDVVRIEREMQALEGDFRAIEESHGKNVLNLVLVVGYLRRLLGSAAVVKFLSKKYPDIFAEWEKLAAATELSAAEPAAED